jgi:ferredoxin
MDACPDCKHSLEDNMHGFDQNDGWLEEDSFSPTGYRLVHSGRCTYCKECNPRIFTEDVRGVDKCPK